MNRNEIDVSINEIKSALKSINKTEQDTNQALRMPIWLNIIISISFGMGVFSLASTRHDNLWMLGVIISSVVFFIAVGIYVYSNRLLGIKVKVLPTHKSELKFAIIVAIIFALLVGFTRAYSIGEFWWIAYVGAIISGFSFAYMLHFFPSGDYRIGKNKNV